MQHDYTGATTLAAPREPAREAAASAKGRLRQFWNRSMGFIARYRARHQLLALDEYVLRDMGLTRADAPRSLTDPGIDQLPLHRLDARERAFLITPSRLM